MRSTLLVFASLAASLAAQTQTPIALSLRQAVEIALAPDGSARAALAEEAVEQAQERVRQARAAFLPTIDGSVVERRQTVNLRTFGFNFTSPGVPFQIPGFVGPFNVFDARATAQQSILNFADMKRYRAAKENSAAVKSDQDATRNQVRDEIARAYLACLVTSANRDTARANVELSEALLGLANRQRNAGTGTGIEVTRADAQLANDRQRLIHAENERSRAILQLIKLMGLPMSSVVELTDALTFQPVEEKPVEDRIAEARKNRPDLRTQELRESAARFTQSAISAERLPTIGASGDFGTIGQAVVGSRGTYTMGVALRIPVFDGGRRDARRQEAFSVYKQEQIRSRDLGRQVELQVRVALENLRSAAAEVQASNTGRTLAENELAQARRRYEAGVASSIEVTDAQTRVQRSRDNQTAALYDYNLARIDLATATGTIAEYTNQ